jgi:hypothetical protein
LKVASPQCPMNVQKYQFRTSANYIGPFSTNSLISIKQLRDSDAIPIGVVSNMPKLGKS